MARLIVHAFSVSLDLYGASESQDLSNPLGVGGSASHEWFFVTRTYHRMTGRDGGTIGIDDRFAAAGFQDVGAWIIGRNMFGPVRGPWPDHAWTGWWGDEPPFHTPVFVLTHHARPTLTMRGGTTFQFVTEGFREALRLATEAAGENRIRLGGGVDTVRQYLSARLVDEMHLAVAPVLFGRGENLLQGIDLPSLGYRCSSSIPGEAATHVTIVKSGGDK